MPHVKKYDFTNLDFIAMLAHDMKTPVKAQIRAMNLLYSGAYGEFSEETKNLIKNIIASNKYMQCLVDNVLSDYRMNRGKFILNKAENDLRKTIEEVINNIGILSEVKGQRIIINYLTDNFLCLYDEIEIQRVIANLFSNAFEYAKENSSIELTLGKKQGQIEILFKSLNPSFARFSFNNYKAGAGLGLIICETIINAHNGEFIKDYGDKDLYITGFRLPLIH